MDRILCSFVAFNLVFAVSVAIKVFYGKALLENNKHLSKGNRTTSSQKHEVMFAIKQQNLENVHKILMDVSDPNNINYGKHLTREELASLTANLEATKVLQTYLNINGATIIKKTKNGDYITASAPIAIWEKLFNAEFFDFVNHDTKTPVIYARALEYSIDEELIPYVEAVFHTVQLPVLITSKVPLRRAEVVSDSSGSITPATLKSYYNITSNIGSVKASQSVFETMSQTYSERDLQQFQNQYGIPSQSVSTIIGDHESDSYCEWEPGNCAEANLDVQYLIGVSQVTPTTYWYVDEPNSFLNWIIALSDSVNPPLVNSISFGSLETATSDDVAQQFSIEAMKLGTLGVTILVASGDDGALNFGGRSGVCEYQPSFPATVPYVTAVGATQGPESGLTETVCSSATGGVITSGGGFSTKFNAPSWQTSAISTYFSKLKTKPIAGYSTTGRGYPDISLAGLNYEILISYGIYYVSRVCYLIHNYLLSISRYLYLLYVYLI